jgi:hypothetical protein
VLTCSLTTAPLAVLGKLPEALRLEDGLALVVRQLTERLERDMTGDLGKRLSHPVTDHKSMNPTDPIDQADLVASDAKGDVASRRWTGWPVCPECGRRRQTRCPTCQLGRDDFFRAEMFFAAHRTTVRSGAVSDPPAPENSDDERPAVMLMCPLCEEAFFPEFYWFCQQCGHDFGGGVLVETSEPDELTDRALFVLAAMIGLLVALLAYFWFIIHSG